LVEIITKSNPEANSIIATVAKGSEHITLYDLVFQGNDWEDKLGILRQNAFSGNQELKKLLQKDIDDDVSLKIWNTLESAGVIDSYGRPSTGIDSARPFNLESLFNELGEKIMTIMKI